jgi:hypothetical protein
MCFSESLRGKGGYIVVVDYIDTKLDDVNQSRRHTGCTRRRRGQLVGIGFGHGAEDICKLRRSVHQMAMNPMKQIEDMFEMSW